MSGKREQKLDRSRKADKVMPDTHREFLDMDTDEEDFGRQETPEIEEESLPEPERPVYKDEELNSLVKFVQDLVVLSSLKEADWNETCCEVIREYFSNPVHDILTIFYENGVLTTSLYIPKYHSTEFNYFLRPVWHIFTVDNFLSTISFGTINEDIDKSTLRFIDNVYAPIALNSQSWSKIIQNNLFCNLHNFIECLMDRIYKSMGVTVLYVPRENMCKINTNLDEAFNCFLENAENFNSSEEKRKELKEFNTRLEKVVYHWIKQIRNTTRLMPPRNNIQSVLDEVNYWNARHSNLNSLLTQLLSNDVRFIVQILTYFRSPTVELFDDLLEALRSSIKEASSNSMYLNILAESAKDLIVPEESEHFLEKCLLVILFIWTESPYYNTVNKIQTLCGTLSTQIINQCKRKINLNAILVTEPEDGIAIVTKCIKCCDSYKMIYDKLTKEMCPLINSNSTWKVEEDAVFNNINTFKQRCYDVIDICKALIVYGRCKDFGLFGTPKGTDFELYCRKIENIFYESLEEVRLSQTITFDVTNSKWLAKIRKFRNSIMLLENMAKNLILEIFSYVENVEEGIEALYGLSKYRQVECLREVLQKKHSQVWKLFHNEIEFCYMRAMNLKGKNDELCNILSITQYLQKQHDVMIKASYWLESNAAETEILQEYKRVLRALNNRQNELTGNARA